MIYTKTTTTTIKDALIENNQVISQALNKLWSAKVDKAPSDDDPAREKVLSDFNFNSTYKQKLDALETTITTAIKALDVDDTANERKYVSSVNEVDGKIVVERAEHLGGIKTMPEAGFDGTDLYNTKFLYTNNEGKLVYYSPLVLRVGQTVNLASAAQLCTEPVINQLMVLAQNPVTIGYDTDHEYLLIRSGSASNSVIIDYMVDGKSESQFSSETCTWSAGVPALTITTNILNTAAKNGLDIHIIINPQATFDDPVIILRETDVTDDYKDEYHPTDAEKCKLVSRLGVERAMQDAQQRMDRLEARIAELESKHAPDIADGTALLVVDAEGNEINAMVVDENGNEVPAEIVKQGE